MNQGEQVSRLSPERMSNLWEGFYFDNCINISGISHSTSATSLGHNCTGLCPSHQGECGSRLGNEKAGTNWLSSSSHSTCQSSLRTRTCCCLPSKGPSHIGCPLWKILYILRWGEWLHQSFTDIGAGGVPVPFNSILLHGRLHPCSFYPCKWQAWRTWHHPFP